jgi:Flp pilus assembly protein TadB
MDTFEKVEKLREKANVTFEEAKAALEESNGDLLDAMILLEKQGKAETRKETYSTKESRELVVVDQPEEKKEKKRGNAFTDKLKVLWHKSCENYFVVERKDETIINIPIWVFIIILLCTWHITLVIMVVALFFGCRYSFKGADEMKLANDVCDKVSEAADKVKEEYNKL